MFKSRVLAIAAALFTATSAQAITVDFEDLTTPGGYTHYENSGFSTQGFDFHVSYGNIMDSDFWFADYYASNNGTDWVMHNAVGSDLTVSAGGSLFALSSVDAGQIWARNNTDDIQVTGYQQGGTTISQTIASKSNFQTTLFSRWTDLWKVTFSGNGYGAYDNFVLSSVSTTAVPLPSPILMLGSAIGLMGFAGMRRKSQKA